VTWKKTPLGLANQAQWAMHCSCAFLSTTVDQLHCAWRLRVSGEPLGGLETRRGLHRELLLLLLEMGFPRVPVVWITRRIPAARVCPSIHFWSFPSSIASSIHPTMTLLPRRHLLQRRQSAGVVPCNPECGLWCRCWPGGRSRLHTRGRRMRVLTRGQHQHMFKHVT